MSAPLSPRRVWLLRLAFPVWLAAIVAGLFWLANHSGTPGAMPPLAAHWPQQNRLQLSSRGLTLVLFAHPRCPCTRASLDELARITTRHPEVSCWVVMFQPTDSQDDWQTVCTQTAATLPGVHVLCDHGAELARQFHVVTSGQALLFDAAGDLLFSGGITSARGHAGDNAGQAAIDAHLAGQDPGYARTPVFGCSLVADPSRDQEYENVP